MSNTSESGFVLVATLWFVAMLALASIVIEGWISTALDRSAALGERVAAQSDLLSAEERIAFALASGSASARGLELQPPVGVADTAAARADAALPEGPFIALDERPYRLGDIVVRLQDAAGLYDINGADRNMLEKVLKSFGLAAGEREKLAMALLDYVGRAGDRAAESARDGDYSGAGLPPPRYQPFLTPWEPLRVLGWAGQDALWQRSLPFFEIATLGPFGGVNVNTAPVEMLTALTGVDPREAARLVAGRIARPISDLRDLNVDRAASELEDHPLVLTPSNIIRVKLIEPGEPLMRIIEVRLTPTGAAPLRVDYAVALPVDAAGRTAARAARLPALPAVPEPAASR